MKFEIEDEGEFLWDPIEDGFNWVTDEEVTDHGRWNVRYQRVAQKVDDGTFWQFNWNTPATEYQEVDLNLTYVQVYPKQVTTTIYTTNKD